MFKLDIMGSDAQAMYLTADTKCLEKSEVRFMAGPNRMTEDQKAYGIFGKIAIKTSDIENFSDVAYNKTITCNVSMGKLGDSFLVRINGAQINQEPLPAFPFTSDFTNAICRIIHENIVEQGLEEVALEIANAGEPKQKEFRTNRRAKLSTMKTLASVSDAIGE